ncbi:MAG: hypothetical protein ACXWM8_07110 [Candidatus Limnocylindrales bacterium]
MTFAESVLHLVLAGARIDTPAVTDKADSLEAVAEAPADVLAGDIAQAASANAARSAQPVDEYEPGLADLEAAVGLVSAGLATRVVLSGFPSWPGLLWRAYRLAETNGVLILPTVVRPGGKVDIVITRDSAADG